MRLVIISHSFPKYIFSIVLLRVSCCISSFFYILRTLDMQGGKRLTCDNTQNALPDSDMLQREERSMKTVCGFIRFIQFH